MRREGRKKEIRDIQGWYLEREGKGGAASCPTTRRCPWELQEGLVALVYSHPWLHTVVFRNLFLWNRLYAVREAPLPFWMKKLDLNEERFHVQNMDGGRNIQLYSYGRGKAKMPAFTEPTLALVGSTSWGGVECEQTQAPRSNLRQHHPPPEPKLWCAWTTALPNLSQLWRHHAPTHLIRQAQQTPAGPPQTRLHCCKSLIELADMNNPVSTQIRSQTPAASALLWSWQCMQETLVCTHSQVHIISQQIRHPLDCLPSQYRATGGAAGH
jgi:hypothetical protein